MKHTTSAHRHRTLMLATPLMHGSDVELLQHLLAEFHCYHGKIDGEFGHLTAQAVYRAKYRLGYPDKNLNQKAGRVLTAYLSGHEQPSAAMVKLAHERATKKPVGISKGRQMLAWEHTQVGYKEHRPPYDFDNGTKYGAEYGENGVPWCAIFQSIGAKRVGLNFHYAFVPAVVSDARFARGGLTLLHVSQLFPGAMACFDWNHDGEADHIGCFDHWVVPGEQFATVEGNTGEADKSNGGEVLAPTDRYVSEVIAFVKIGGSS